MTKFLRFIDDNFAEVDGTRVSAGVANAGDIPALDATGRLDASLMPIGVGDDSFQVIASEDLTAGNFVNIFADEDGNARVRKASATDKTAPCMGFVRNTVTAGTALKVFFEGTNSFVTGQTPGKVFLQRTAGRAGPAAPYLPGNILQSVGVAVSPTAINFEAGTPVTRV